MLPEEVGSELGLRGSPVLQPPTETIGTSGTSSMIVANGIPIIALGTMRWD
jgi:hypothetical protein